MGLAGDHQPIGQLRVWTAARSAGIDARVDHERSRASPSALPPSGWHCESLEWVPAHQWPHPLRWQAFQQQNAAVQQTQAPSHWSQLGEGDYLALHQCADGALVFPLQLAGWLSQPGQNFSGGELVMNEQRPRMPSRPMGLPLQDTDAALICTAQRPVDGIRIEYRAIPNRRTAVRVAAHALACSCHSIAPRQTAVLICVAIWSKQPAHA